METRDCQPSGNLRTCQDGKTRPVERVQQPLPNLGISATSGRQFFASPRVPGLQNSTRSSSEIVKPARRLGTRSVSRPAPEYFVKNDRPLNLNSTHEE